MNCHAESYQLDSTNDCGVAVTNIENQAMSIEYFVGNMAAQTTRFDASVVSNGYDQAGRLSYVEHGSASVPLASVAYEYDRLDRLVASTSSVSSVTSVLNHQYDAVGNRTNRVVRIE